MSMFFINHIMCKYLNMPYQSCRYVQPCKNIDSINLKINKFGLGLVIIKKLNFDFSLLLLSLRFRGCWMFGLDS